MTHQLPLSHLKLEVHSETVIQTVRDIVHDHPLELFVYRVVPVVSVFPPPLSLFLSSPTPGSLLSSRYSRLLSNSFSLRFWTLFFISCPVTFFKSGGIEKGKGGFEDDDGLWLEGCVRKRYVRKSERLRSSESGLTTKPQKLCFYLSIPCPFGSEKSLYMISVWFEQYICASYSRC